MPFLQTPYRRLAAVAAVADHDHSAMGALSDSGPVLRLADLISEVPQSGRIVLLPFQRTKNGLKKTHGHIKPTKLPRYEGFLKCRSSSKFYHDFVLNPPEMTGIHWDFTIQIHGRKLCHEWK